MNKNSSFADFVRFCPYTYAYAQEFLLSLWAAIIMATSMTKCAIKTQAEDHGLLFLY